MNLQRRDNDRARKRRGPRPRTTYVWFVGLIVIALSLLTDPDSGFIQQLPWGAGTVATLIILSKGILYATLVHYTRKGLLDYFRLEDAWNTCKTTPVSAGLFSIAAAIMTLAFALAIFTAVSK